MWRSDKKTDGDTSSIHEKTLKLWLKTVAENNGIDELRKTVNL